MKPRDPLEWGRGDWSMLRDEDNQMALHKQITKLGYLSDDCSDVWELLDAPSFARKSGTLKRIPCPWGRCQWNIMIVTQGLVSTVESDS